MNQFEFTTASNEIISSKLDIFKNLQTILNNNLNLVNYTQIVTSIFMIYQCFPANSQYFKAKDYKRIRQKNSVIEIYSLLDYDKIMISNPKEIQIILWQTYLNSITNHLKIKDFNQQKFYSDVNFLYNQLNIN